MARCLKCGRDSRTVARALAYCADCIRGHYPALQSRTSRTRAAARASFGLPTEPPRDADGARCNFCVNECIVPEGSRGFCGVRVNVGGRMVGGTAWANVSWYHDALPTNCVAAWACAASAGCGYPKFSHTPDTERGFYNLAVFYQACSFDCLFCQNWHFRRVAAAIEPGGASAIRPGGVAAEVSAGAGEPVGGAASSAHAVAGRTPAGAVEAAVLAAAADERTSCICYFGGDPAPQMVHSIVTSRLARRHKHGAILRICWETNGSSNPDLLRAAVDTSIESGGCMKFDLKAWDDNLHKTLCGVTNKRTMANFKEMAGYALKTRQDPPPVVASTLLVPGYIDEREVHNIAKHIASVDRDIPYSLLAFHPQYCMDDLPTTAAAHALKCLDAAEAAGLTRVRLGNRHLLGPDYS